MASEQRRNKEIKLTRAAIREFVGKDDRKVKAIEQVIATSVIVDEKDIDTDIQVTFWNNGRMELYGELTSSAAGATTVTLPENFLLIDRDGQPVKVIWTGNNVDSATVEDFTVKFSNFVDADPQTIDIVQTKNGAYVAADLTWRAIGRWK